jgi:acetyltransferase-like isoleucine patch superfamily enzyme
MIWRILNFFRTQRDNMLLRRCIKAGLQIGKDVSIMNRPDFGFEPYLVKIGNHVSLATGVKFITHDGGTYVFRERPEYKGLRRYDTIEIKDNCLIGVNVVIMPGVTIGPNSIVGANSVVNRSVPPNTVVSGCPVQHICTYEEYIQKIVPKCRHYPLDVLPVPEKMREFTLAALKKERGDDIFRRPESDTTA